MSIDCVMRSLAPAYSIGALDPDDLARFERHLVDGCPACEREITEADRVAYLLAHTPPNVAPPTSLRSRLMAEIGVTPAVDWSEFLGVGEWQPHKIAGMHCRVLEVDEAGREITMIVRAEAGAWYPPHRHARVEHLLMLQGELLIGDQIYGPGAFVTSGRDSIHPPSVTPNGCMFLIRTSLDDETLASHDRGSSEGTHPPM